MLHLSRGIKSKMFDHARDDYPSECCGILTKQGKEFYSVHRCQNVQDKFHEKDPKNHPRTSKEAYRMNDMEVLRIQKEIEEVGGRLVAFYHSHVDCGAYFSKEDQKAAILGEPAYPGVIYLVISSIKQVIRGFQWEEKKRCFEEIALEWKE